MTVIVSYETDGIQGKDMGINSCTVLLLVLMFPSIEVHLYERVSWGVFIFN